MEVDSMRKVLIGFIILLALALIGTSIAWTFLQGPVDVNDKKEVEVEIKIGTSSTAIGNNYT